MNPNASNIRVTESERKSINRNHVGFTACQSDGDKIPVSFNQNGLTSIAVYVYYYSSDSNDWEKYDDRK